jgi:hypothetical protein
MKHNLVTHLSTKQLQRALSLRERIDAYETELLSVIGADSPGDRSPGPAAKPGRKRKNRMTAAGRAALAASMRARWRKAKSAGRGTL